jgi:ATP-dependent protease ClpP protease subunit
LYMSRLTPTAWKTDKPTDEKRREYVQTLIDRGDQSFNDWMSAEEAIEVGMITEIVSDKLDIFKD